MKKKKKNSVKCFDAIKSFLEAIFPTLFSWEIKSFLENSVIEINDY